MNRHTCRFDVQFPGQTSAGDRHAADIAIVENRAAGWGA
jgi:hypothetical protein